MSCLVLANKLVGMAKPVVSIYKMPICNKYIFGSGLQYTLDSLCNGYFPDILNNSLCRQVSHAILTSSSICIYGWNILPILIKLAFLFKVLLCRLVLLTDFIEIQLSKGDICRKGDICWKTWNIKKNKKSNFVCRIVFAKVLKTCKYNS